jgi:hypothetical protein
MGKEGEKKPQQAAAVGGGSETAQDAPLGLFWAKFLGFIGSWLWASTRQYS